MPELPDITIYLEALDRRVTGTLLRSIRLNSIFFLRSTDPAISTAEGRTVTGLRRLGKRIVFALEEPAPPLFLVLHLMKAGRLQWKTPGAAARGRRTLAALDFSTGTLLITEAGTRKRASLYLVRGAEALARHDPGGLEILQADVDAFSAALTQTNHTLKRALTDPRILSGVGSAYADEILHRARLSPVQRTQNLTAADLHRLFEACRSVLHEWITRLRTDTADRWPAKVTAFRPGMAAHGRYKDPCPVCGHPIQRIVYAETETNYCAACQTGGRLLKDRALSRLLKEDWPRSLADLEDAGLYRQDA